MREQLNSKDTPHSYEEMIKMEEEINDNVLDDGTEAELNEMTRSCIPIEEMIKYDLFEKLICKLDYRKKCNSLFNRFGYIG